LRSRRSYPFSGARSQSPLALGYGRPLHWQQGQGSFRHDPRQIHCLSTSVRAHGESEEEMSTRGDLRVGGRTVVCPEMLVVAFDICSSAAMLETLILSGHDEAFTDLLKGVHEWLESHHDEYAYSIYKFTGDGWILLFHDPREHLKGNRLLRFLVALSEEYRELRTQKVVPYLEGVMSDKGLTFGIAVGHRVRRIILDKTEYVGRALVLASRLQATVKVVQRSPDYIVLATVEASRFLRRASDVRFGQVRHRLRNILAGVPFRIRRLDLNEHMAKPRAKRAAGASRSSA
jgi:class 3 adenylate cyclase